MYVTYATFVTIKRVGRPFITFLHYARDLYSTLAMIIHRDIQPNLTQLRSAI